MLEEHQKKELKTLCVVFSSAVIMVVEIIFGITSKSMALLADFIHMGSVLLDVEPSHKGQN
tara:strand:+ start:1665 stop:1847 length:183 start_codon:yes stop_codon:yes gene_type:complete